MAAWVTTFNAPNILEADVEGQTIQNLAAYRAQAPMFSITTPADNLMGTGIAGTYSPNGSFGYWLMLTPLKPGPHTVHFSSGNGWLDLTYSITVAK